MSDYLMSIKPRIAPQQYGASRSEARPETAAGPRGTQESFVSGPAAFAAGTSVNLRIHLEWGALTSGDVGADGRHRMCTATGQTGVFVRSGGSETDDWSASEDYPDSTCVAGMVVLPDSKILAILEQRANWAVDRWSEALQVNPIADSIEIDSSLSEDMGLPAKEGGGSYWYNDTDLVMVMHARPSPIDPVAGWAYCGQRDQYGRCTVGFFNMVPELMIPDESTSPMVMEQERHTVLHEMGHTLGAVITSTAFVNSDGTTRNASDVFEVATALLPGTAEGTEDPPNKPVTLVKSALVLAKAREQYGCDELRGVPLEDIPLGRAAHWESRVMGPELMSYGSYTGEAYLSDLTLAFLEDTNHYKANFSAGGRLVEPDIAQGSGDSIVGFSLFLSGGDKQVAAAPEPLTPGYLRWGRGEGCGFVEQKPSLETWTNRYLCWKQQQYGCTPDNRLAAVCAINTGITVSSSYTCTGASDDCQARLNDNCEGSSCGIPSEMQYFLTDAEAAAAFTSDAGAIGQALGQPGSSAPDGVTVTASNTGGSSSSMDFVPIRVGYWSCLHSEPQQNMTGRASEEGSSFNFDNLISAVTPSLDSFGAQSRCPECRCFTSSLVELSQPQLFGSGLSFGLCYRANCATTSILQVGLRSQTDGSTVWYRCPSSGGPLYIPGFVGSLTCPVSSEFCSQEQVTGVLHSEHDLLLEWIVYGSVLALLVLVFILGLFRCIREPSAHYCKARCGVLEFGAVETKNYRQHLLNLRHKRDFNHVLWRETITGLEVRPMLVMYAATGGKGLENDNMPSDAERHDTLQALLRTGSANNSTLPMDGFDLTPPSGCAARSLLVTSVLTLIMCLVITGLAVYATATGTVRGAMYYAVLGLVGFYVASNGTQGARYGGAGASCGAVLYFSCGLAILLSLIYTLFYVAISEDVMRQHVKDNLFTYIDLLPENAVDESGSEEQQVDQAVTALAGYFWGAVAAGIVLLGLLLLSVWAAARIITVPVLSSTLFVTLTYAALVIGSVVCGLGLTLAKRQGASLSDDSSTVSLGRLGLLAGISGAMFAIVGLFSFCALLLRKLGMFYLGSGLSVTVAIVVGLASYFSLEALGNADRYLAGLTTEERSAVVESLEISDGASDEQIATAIKAMLRRMTLAGVILIVLLLLHAVVGAKYGLTLQWRWQLASERKRLEESQERLPSSMGRPGDAAAAALEQQLQGRSAGRVEVRQQSRPQSEGNDSGHHRTPMQAISHQQVEPGLGDAPRGSGPPLQRQGPPSRHGSAARRSAAAADDPLVISDTPGPEPPGPIYTRRRGPEPPGPGMVHAVPPPARAGPSANFQSGRRDSGGASDLLTSVSMAAHKRHTAAIMAQRQRQQAQAAGRR